MSEYHFDTPHPVQLYVEIGKGRVTVMADDLPDTEVIVRGRDAEQVRVERTGNEITVVAPRQRTGFLASDSAVEVEVTLPTDSALAIRTGSAEIAVRGRVGESRIKSGSGDVRVETLARPASIETGSGDVRVDDAHAELRIKCGSGDVVLGQVGEALAVSTGSGDVEITTASGPADVKTGSGDLRVSTAQNDVSLTTGSGDFVVEKATRGRLTAKGASGDVRVGIPAGIPVWTDVLTATGEVHSNLAGAGEPQDGADHVELRAKTASGDIILTEL